MLSNLLYKFAAEPIVDISPLPSPAADQAQISTIVGVVFAIAGSLALLFIVIGGFRYIISRGDPSATAQAKNTILYALVGLVVTASAYAIVRLVLKNVA